MKKLLLLAGLTACAYAATTTISDTLYSSVGGGAWAGKITVSLNSPASAQPLYAGSTSLAGWQAVYCLGVTGTDCTATSAAGAVSIVIWPTDQITPGGTSYTARYQPTRGAAWSETWVIATGDTNLRQIRSTTVPTPTTTFALSQLSGGGATTGQYLQYSGSSWGPVTLSALSDPTTTTGDIIYRSGATLTRLGIGSTGQVLKVSGGVPSWAAESGGGAVSSVFSRTGAVVATSGDYTYSQVTGAVGGGGNLTSTGHVPYISASGVLNQDSGALVWDATNNRLGINVPSPTTALDVSGTVTATAFAGPLTGNVTGNVSGSSGSTTGNAATATALQTGRAINGVTFDGTAAITVTAAAGTLTGTTLNSTVVSSSLTSVGTIATGVWQGSVIGSAYGGAGTVNGILKANGSGTVSAATSGVDYLTPGDLSQIAFSGDLTDGTGILGAANGGTGTGTATDDAVLVGSGSAWVASVLPSCSNATTSKLLYNSTTNAFSCGTDQGGGASGTVTDVSWTGGIVSIATSTTTPAFTVAGTSGGIPYFSSASTWASSGALTSGAIVLGGGAGGAPTVLANSSSPNASQLWVHQTNAAASATQAALLVGPTSMSGWNASGTYIGVAAQTGFGGLLIDARVNNSTVFSVNQFGISAPWTIQSTAIGNNANGAATISNSSSGASSVLRLQGSAGTAATNYVALRGSSTYSNDQLRVFANNPMVAIGQRSAATSATNISLYVEDNTATTGVTRVSIQEGVGQSTTPGFEYRLTSGTLNAGTLVWSISAGGEPTWGSTTEATCASGTRGQVVMVHGGAGVADTFRICAKNSSDAYNWTALF